MQLIKLQYPASRKQFFDLETDRMNGWPVKYYAPSLEGRQITPTQADRMLTAGQVIMTSGKETV